MWATLVLLVGLATPSLASPPQDAITVGGPALAFDLPALNPDAAIAIVRQNRISLHDLVGIRPPHAQRGVVLYFFDRGASGQGLKIVDALDRRYREDGVRSLGICLDDEPTAADWVRGLSLTFPVLADPHHVVADRYHVRTLPFVVLVDAEGKVFAAGGPDAMDLEGPLELEIANLLRLGPPAVR